ncbi:MAG TPA: hypothetical protein VH309_09100 [Elusimicrobiota bacterium]|jgi:hypothetical protein|nr:hypothetical protein [Elusimicrobiota bacterium]
MTTLSNQPTIWLVTGPIVFLYLAAAAMVYLLREANDRICSTASKEEAMSPAVIVLLTLVTNLLCVATLVLASNALSSSLRFSMLALPLILLVERYGMIVLREPARRGAAIAGLGGSVAGLAVGAWMFMRGVTAAEPIARVTIPGDVRTLSLTELARNGGDWSVSLKLVTFYAIAVTIFFGLHALLKRAAKSLLSCPPEARRMRTLLAVLIAFALNFLGVVTVVLMAKSSDVQTRLAMVGFPLFLIVESYAKLLRAEPQNRPSHWTGLIGSSVGMALACFLLLRGAPLY